MANLHLQLVTPTGKTLDTEAHSITIPTTLGQITVLPGHTDLIATIKPGELVTKTGNEVHTIHVAGGFVQIKQGSEVILLADEAEHVTRLNEAQAQEAKERAEKLLAQTNLSDEEYAKAASMLEVNMSKLSTIRRHAHRTRKPITSEGVMNE
jgi:F-type H+-transporting ATPase subunit epsilon